MCELAVAHAGVQIDVAGADEEGSVGRDLEPRVHLPDDVEEDDQRKSETRLEKSVGVW